MGFVEFQLGFFWAGTSHLSWGHIALPKLWRELGLGWPLHNPSTINIHSLVISAIPIVRQFAFVVR